MNIIYIPDAETNPNPHGIEAKKVYDSEHALVMHIHLKPGESLRRHITPVDVIFYVLEGKGIVEVGDEKREVDTDTIIDSPAKIPHCWYNESDADLRVLVIKVPRPVESTKLL